MRKFLINILAAAMLFSCLGITGLADEAEQLTEDIFTYAVSGGKATVTNIDDSRSRVEIPDTLGGYTVTSIAPGACGGSSTINEVVIADTVTSIGKMSFAYSSGIKSVKLPAGLKEIDEGAFYQCENLWTISIPEGTAAVGNNAFALCSNLTAVTAPNSLTQIGSVAFGQAPGLRIYASWGSAAQIYAETNNIGYEELIHVKVNGNVIVFDQPCITDTENYHTLVPMRAVLESLDGKVKWDEMMNMARIDVLGSRLLIRPGEPFMMVNGKVYYLNSSAVEFNNRLMLPIRDVIEALGGKVVWSEEQKLITITINS